jgi:2Fe-2S ferredoxin
MTHNRSAQITFLPLGQTVEADLDGLVYQRHGRPGSILDVALNAGVRLPHVCGGNCACTTCHVIVREGEHLLSLVEEAEADRLGLAAGATLHSRLACQAVVQDPGRIVVEIPEWNRNL